MEGATWYYNDWEYSFRVDTDICSISSIFNAMLCVVSDPTLVKVMAWPI